MAHEEFQMPTGKEFEKLKKQFDKTQKDLSAFYNRKSLPEIMGVARKEVAHSSFIAWLLDPNGSHGLGVKPLTKFCGLVYKRYKQYKRYIQQDADPKLFRNTGANIEALGARPLSIFVDDANPVVQTEVAFKGIEDRLDIVVQCQINGQDFHIVVENKVGITESKAKDGEGPKQTQRYFDDYSTFCAKEYPLASLVFVFLTARSGVEVNNMQEPECSCKEFVQICYQDILDDIIAPALKRKGLSEYTCAILQEYVKCLSVLSLNEHKPNDYIVMATESGEQEKLNEFLTKNEWLIKAAFYARAQSDDIDEATRELYLKISNHKTYKRDTTKFSFTIDAATLQDIQSLDFINYKKDELQTLENCICVKALVVICSYLLVKNKQGALKKIFNIRNSHSVNPYNNKGVKESNVYIGRNGDIKVSINKYPGTDYVKQIINECHAELNGIVRM